ncbi:hypothetical protein BASA50_003766 [Batrachochytrium salamandrivorans]|uniref:Uncharacterized protein n=1 Tax=Batrachochytrium salamandrivorans TaxID=1357716 RepID=A0ABQ8FIE6_9FUNG|nr:hypothetical protein BASA62_003904 [Batrachochytrium salamandrivorans]KAH6574087.1 hypothetical protein BASA60_005683 [Batrachochytrium salamandrivorans]KAH6598731.1 hypothetical protein BASA50_003766 [Batrachochytrium salamandrivorans]
MVVFGGDEVSALVFDIGSRLTKVGYAGEDTPKGVFSSFVGSVYDGSSNAASVPMDMDVDMDHSQNDGSVKTDVPLKQPEKQAQKFLVGDSSIYKWRENLHVKSPLVDGVVEDWDALEAIWDHAYTSVLRADPTEHPLMFCEPSWNPRDKREKLCEIAFEKYNVPGFYLGRSAVLSAFAAGKSSALVVDSGSSCTSVVPVHDGYVLKKGIRKASLGGDFVSDQIRLYLESIGVDLVPQYLVEKKTAVVSSTPANYVAAHRPSTTSSYHDFGMECLLQEFKETVIQVSEIAFDEKSLRKRLPKSFEFPNGFNRPFGIDRFKCVEGLFQPEFILRRPGVVVTPADALTIPHLIHASINECDNDIRSGMYSSVVLTGANTLLPGFADRLYSELHHGAPGARIKVHAAGGSSERKFGPWIGGSIFASLGSFHQLWISKQQYEEMGSSVEKRIH